MLIIPSLTFPFGPLGPSTIIPAEFPSFNFSISSREAATPLLLVEPLTDFIFKHSAAFAIISPSLDALIKA